MERDLRDSRGPVDVFGTLLRVDAALVFRPLEGLLGARLPKPASGVIISTQRPLPVQRFTGAHELGHVVMNHSASLDGEEIIRETNTLQETNEIQANSFASEFLMPRWLLAMHGRAQDWNRESLKNPTVVYQLSLRLGTSYAATCFALMTQGLIDGATLSELRKVSRRAIKQALIPGYTPENWYRDVWLLTEKDEGAALLGQPDDLFLFRLCEKSGAGYLWDIEELKTRGFIIVEDMRTLLESEHTIGGDIQRTIAAQAEHATAGDIALTQRRPWQPLRTAIEELHIRYDLRGKEEGLSRAARQQLQAA